MRAKGEGASLAIGQPRALYWGMAACVAAMSIFFLAITLQQQGSAGDVLIGLAAAGVNGLLCVVCVRMARREVWIGSEQVVVRNLRHTFRFGLEDCRRFSASLPLLAGDPAVAPFLELADGRRIGCGALVPIFGASLEEIQNAVFLADTELMKRRSQARHAPTGDAG